jgi:hypothetical protein
MNCGHSWCLRGSRVSCGQVFTLQGWLLIGISTTLSKMGDDNYMDDDDYFVAMSYDNHIVFVTFPCLD